MAFPIVASSAQNVARGGNGSGVGNVKPTSVAVGDMLISEGVAINGSNGTMTIAAPATGGWTTLYTGTSRGIFWKIADAADVAASDLKPVYSGGTNSNDVCGAQVFRITGHDATVAPVFNSGDVSSTSLTSSGISPSLQSLLLITVLGYVADTVVRTVSGYAIANSNPSWTEIVDNGLSNSGTSCINFAAAKANETGNPGTSTGNATATASLTETATIAIIAIQPARIIATPFVMTGVINTTTFVRRMVVTALALTAVLKVPTVSEIAATWTNLSKNVTAWINQSKS